MNILAPRIRRLAVFLSSVILGVTASGCGWIADLREENKGIQLDRLTVPAGYKVSLLTRDIAGARALALGPDNLVFVSTAKGDVHALRVAGDQLARSRVIASDLQPGVGVAWRDGALFVASRIRVVRYDNVNGDAAPLSAPVTVIDQLPDKERHGARYIAVGPDGKLYVSIGSPCNVCKPEGDEFGVIVRVNPDGSGREVVARGIRNTVGFDWHPATRELWFSENGQDELGPDRPSDELNRVSRTGEHFGFPYCHGMNIADPKFGAERKCSEFTPPAFGLGAHVGSLGMRFVGGDAAPAELRDSVLVARHGSHPPLRVGYDVVRVRLSGAGAATMEPFLQGFLQGRVYWGRPADVLVMRDGSVLVSDDLNGAIYRVARQ